MENNIAAYLIRCHTHLSNQGSKCARETSDLSKVNTTYRSNKQHKINSQFSHSKINGATGDDAVGWITQTKVRVYLRAYQSSSHDLSQRRVCTAAFLAAYNLIQTAQKPCKPTSEKRPLAKAELAVFMHNGPKSIEYKHCLISWSRYWIGMCLYEGRRCQYYA